MTLEHENQVLKLPNGQAVGLAVYGADDGFPILALHGAPACRLMFDLTDSFAKDLGLKLYCPDRPGYGRTLPQEPVSMHSRVAFLTAVADQLGLAKFGVLGISGGGPYATALAAHLPERVCVLGLVSPLGPVADYEAAKTPAFGELHAGHRAFFLKLPKRPKLLKAIAGVSAKAFQWAPRTVANIFTRTMPKSDREILRQPHVAESFLAMTHEALCQGSGGGIADLQVYSKPWPIDYRKIIAPQIIWQGTADRIVPVKVTRYLAGQLPNPDMREIPGAGHFWIYNHIGEMLRGLQRAIVCPSNKD